MLPQLMLKNNASALLRTSSTAGELSTELNLNYNKSSLDRYDNVTTINIDRAIRGKGDFSNTKTYTQNLVKKYELTGNKEVCIRKILVAERDDTLFDVTVRELKIYHRKDKKHHFNKVIRFKTANGTIEHIFEILKNQGAHKSVTIRPVYLLN